jgi:hypothetical protein
MSCRVPRDTIHALRFYSDIIGHEINLSGGRSSRAVRSCREPPPARRWSCFHRRLFTDETGNIWP